MAVAPPPTPTAPRQFGRFELRRMLGRSLASSSWLAWDPRLQQEVQLCVPRAQPGGARERDEWTQDVLAAARLKHPRLAEVLEVGAHDGWPFVSCSRHDGETLIERLQSTSPPTPLDCAHWLCDVLEGLAYVHEGGVAHLDIGLHNVLIDKGGHAKLLGVAAGLQAQAPGAGPKPVQGRQEIRMTSERDVLMAGLLLHRLLANHPALDDNDLHSAATRVGLEIVRLPWGTPHPVPDTLRAIVNRATDRQQRQRYLNARTLLSALQGWVKTHSQESGGPLQLLLDRLNTVGSLPGRPHAERAMLSCLSTDGLRVDDFVDVIVKNPALVWELLRTVNTASYSGQTSEDGVTTLSRAVLLLGQQGLRGVVASVRPWPGALGAQATLAASRQTEGRSAEATLEHELRLTCLAGHVARLMAPFSISDEEACVAAMSQRLGWLLLLYHFPEETAQVTRLTQPQPSAEADTPSAPGMSLEAATSAVLGVNLDDLGVAVMKHWGMHDRLVGATRALSPSKPVRTPSGPGDTLRTVASLANELVQALTLDGPKQVAAQHQVYVRYARAVGLSPKECELTLAHATRLVDQPRPPVARPQP